MARIRSIKPELRISALVASWPIEQRYFWVLLWGYLDDKGRGYDHPKTISGDCFPRDDRITPTVVDKWLDTMTKGIDGTQEGPVCRYQVADRRYLHCLNWREHQKPNRPTPSRLPPCPIHDKPVELLTEPPHAQATQQHSDPYGDPLSERVMSSHVPEGGRRGAGEKRGGAGGEPLTEPPPQPVTRAVPTNPRPPPPPRTCPKHPDGTEAPCRACGTARETHELWAAAQRQRTNAAAKCRTHRGKLAHNCPLCRSEALAGEAS